MLLLSLLVACSGPAHGGGTTPSSPSSSMSCPDGTRAAGEVGVEAWCEDGDGLRHGPYTRWEGGQVAQEGQYRHGQKDGVWTARGSGFESETTYKDGVEVDSVETLGPEEPSDEEEEPPPPVVEEAPPPPVAEEAPPPVEPRWKCPKKTKLVGAMGVEAWCEKKNGKRHGPYTRWDAEGRLEEDGQYENGRREGRWAEFYEGRIAREGPYRHGKKHGVWTARGSGFESETTYKNGVEVDHIETVSDW